MKKKVHKLKDLIKIRKKLKSEGEKVIFTNGCFDILHSGHIHIFKEAKKWGDVLIVGVNDDSSVKKIKGPFRPIFSLEDRMEILEAIEEIDYLVSFSEETPQKIIALLLPDVLVKGGDWKIGEIVGKKEVEKAGGKTVIVPYLKGHSSTEIIKRIIRLGEHQKRNLKRKLEKTKKENMLPQNGN